MKGSSLILGNINIVFIFFMIIVLGMVLIKCKRFFEKYTIINLREKIYLLFLEAENKFFAEEGKGTEKMDYVINQIQQSIPWILSAFISDNFIRKVVQFWFDEIKDFLDDGIINQSTKKK